MKKIRIHTVTKRMLADVHTPVGIYLRLRDRFRDTNLLESTDHHAASDSWSFICVNAIGGIEIRNPRQADIKWPGMPPEKKEINAGTPIPDLLLSYTAQFETSSSGGKETAFAQGLYGYTSYEAVAFFDRIHLQTHPGENAIPLIRYRLYQYIIAINHFRDELFICENQIDGVPSELGLLESLIRSKDVPVYPFSKKDEEKSNMTDEHYREMVSAGIKSCLRGDVFQIVLSRRFEQPFSGDEFNVYRALRSINPSPYLFFFDYGDYKLMGSSPESQLIIRHNRAVVHPIAGTVKRTGDAEQDRQAAASLLADEKENAEHVMLVDLARNDLSRECSDVRVNHYKEVQYFSHVIHMVSEVSGQVPQGKNPYQLFAKSFPAGTLSGAPKIKAMELISGLEPTDRGYYGGAIGFIGMDGSFNHAIMIRTLLSRHNKLTYQAGAGVVAASKPENELQEVNNKLGALKKAIEAAEHIQ